MFCLCDISAQPLPGDRQIPPALGLPPCCSARWKWDDLPPQTTLWFHDPVILPLLLLLVGNGFFFQLLLSRREHHLLLAELAPAVVGGQAGTDQSVMDKVKHFKMWPRLFHSRPRIFGKGKSSELSQVQTGFINWLCLECFPENWEEGEQTPWVTQSRYVQAGSEGSRLPLPLSLPPLCSK